MDAVDGDCGTAGTPACPPNDRPSGATDVTMGGLFDADFTYAHADDNAPKGCGGLTRDVFFSITLGKPETIYFDTLDGGIATELRIYPGITCGSATTGFSCTTGACGTSSSQTATTLPAGTSCIVVAQRSMNTPPGASKLRVIRGGRVGDALPQQTGASTVSDNTCTNGVAQSTSSCVSSSNTAKDMGYYALVCPAGAMIDASSCAAAGASFDNNVYVIRAPTTELACYDDGALCATDPNDGVVQNVAVPGPGLAWVVIDGFNAVCGPFTLMVNVH